MTKIKSLQNKIFNIRNHHDFNAIAIEIFHFQYKNNTIYRQFVDFLNIRTENITNYLQIPFLPIEFFKSHKISSSNLVSDAIFTSSGTTGVQTSEHFVADLTLYESSFIKSFELFFGSVNDYVILALLPSYLERTGSSLVYMANKLIELSHNSKSGFYLDEYDQLNSLLINLFENKQKVILIGVTYALLDLAEQYPFNFPELILMETGGMKGKRKELIRNELHYKLKRAFGVSNIYSEYGMTELLSQAYSKGNGVFSTPPWMKIVIRDVNDPLSILPAGKAGGINVIDFANLYSCSFIATQDLGKVFANSSFEILGRFDSSDVRGCNLMVV
jgi:phenylacetate-coenzyme A ligase PaaK-like adenylate-forming protein